MNNAISIKGTREGLTITLGEGPFDAIMDDLAHHLQTQGAFFRGGVVAAQIGSRSVSEAELQQLCDLLKQHEMLLRTVLTTDATSLQSVKALGLRLGAETTIEPSIAPVEAEPQPAQVRSSLDGSKGILVRHRIRSGQIIRHTGHVVVIGDVNVGAQIIAGGDIVIWGRLYGTVHAGAMGNSSAVICALQLSPIQLRIGDLIARPAEGDRPSEGIPEIAHVRENMIVVDPWNSVPRGVLSDAN